MLTAEDGAGFFPAHHDQLIGPDNRYKVVRMLGSGLLSTTLLIEDTKFTKCCFFVLFAS